MKAVIPAAGQGTRLFPQTHTKPKPMVRLAGKPILGHILDGLVASPIDEVVVVVGVMQEMVIDYVAETYGRELEVDFVEQEQAEGLGHAVYQAEPECAGEPLCIVLGDMLFETGYDTFIEAHHSLGDVDGSIGVKTVEDPSSYGIVTTSNGQITGLEEKPDDPDSNLAISGIYFVEDSAALFDELGAMIEADERGAGDEFQLTDALARMLDANATFGTFEVEDWYDCGRPETLLSANRILLDRRAGTEQEVRIDGDDAIVLPPADVGERVTLSGSVVGPYVSIDDGAEVTESHVSDAIVGRNATVRQVNLTDSLIGDSAAVTGTPNQLNVGDSSEMNL